MPCFSSDSLKVLSLSLSLFLSLPFSLLQALQRRRSQLDNMLIAPPQHMEIMEGYVHRGWVDRGKEGEEYDKPWEWWTTGKGMSSHVLCIMQLQIVSLDVNEYIIYVG